jgi:drug/metabolite transporter (DMT)-like permease
VTLVWTRHERADARRLIGACPGVLGVALIVGLDALEGIGAHTLGQGAALARATRRAGAAAIALGTLCTGLAMIIYLRLLRTLRSVGVASQAHLRAGVGAALGALMLGDTLAATLEPGIVAALPGVVLINLPRRAARP